MAAVAGVVTSVFSMLDDGATHLGVATDHVIESFRNDMYAGYKTSAGVAPELLNQFGLLEDALAALGVKVWAMTDLEADDALASGAAVAADSADVDRVMICTPDKDLGQCVIDGRVVQVDRRRRLVIDEAGVREKFGVGPASIPDYLGLVGDSADGFPGLPGFGAKTSATLLARWQRIEDIPASVADWSVKVRGAEKLARVLAEQRDDALLFKDIATLRVDRSLLRSVDDLRWTGPAPEFAALCELLGTPGLVTRAEKLAGER